MFKRVFIQSVMAIILLFSGIDFVLKTHHIFEEHAHHHDHDAQHSSEDHDDCKICDWVLAAFVDEPVQGFVFSKQEVYIAHQSKLLLSFSQCEKYWPQLRGPPVVG